MEQTKREFDDKIGRLGKSAAYLDYCREVSGYGIYLFNMLDKEQLDFVFNSIPLSSADLVLDIGCGSGSILNELLAKNGCKGVGIDVLPKASIKLDRANARYINADIDDVVELHLQPTLTLLIDSIYFSRDPERLLRSLCSVRNNRIYLFYSQYLFEDGEADKTSLQADFTNVACVLKKLGVSYRTVDYSENERAFYESSICALEKRRDAFISEDVTDLYEGKLQEQLMGKRLYDAGNASRYLYIID